MWLRVLLFGAVLAFLLILAVASTVTVGFSHWCSSFPDVPDDSDITYVAQLHSVVFPSAKPVRAYLNCMQCNVIEVNLCDN